MKAIGHDSLKTTRTLKAGGARIPLLLAARRLRRDRRRQPPAGQPEDPARERAPLRRRQHLQGRTTPAPSPNGPRPAAARSEVPFRPARILMQDFTGVPAVVDLAAMRDGITALGGSPEQVNPLVPVDLVIDHSVMVDCFGQPRRRAQERGDRVRAATASATASCAGARPRSSNFRVVPPGAGICHQVNCRVPRRDRLDRRGRRRRIRLPGHAVRHRQPHHHGQRHRRARLGRRRHRGGGGHARPADRHADPRRDRLPPHRQAARGQHGDRPGADRHADAAQEGRGRQVRRVLRPRPRRPLGRDPADHRQHGAGIRRHLRLLPGRRRHARLPAAHRPRRRRAIALVEAYAKAQGMWSDARHAGAGLTPTSSSSTWPPCCPASPGRSGRRTRCCSRTPPRRSAPTSPRASASRPTTPTSASRSSGKNYEITHGDVVIAAITSCTNTCNPYVMLGAGLLARKARERG